jgi:hypothetical protein
MLIRRGIVLGKVVVVFWLVALWAFYLDKPEPIKYVNPV